MDRVSCVEPSGHATGEVLVTPSTDDIDPIAEVRCSYTFHCVSLLSSLIGGRVAQEAMCGMDALLSQSIQVLRDSCAVL
jgi:hypothetical protein